MEKSNSRLTAMISRCQVFFETAAIDSFLPHTQCMLSDLAIACYKVWKISFKNKL